MAIKHTLFIIDKKGRFRGVKTYPTQRQVMAYAIAEYEGDVDAENAFIVRTETTIVWSRSMKKEA